MMASIGQLFRQAIDTLVQHPFLLDEFKSVGLLFLGLGASIVVIIKSFGFDDPYPGYGKLSRQQAKLAKNFNLQQTRAFDEMNILINDGSKEINHDLSTLKSGRSRVNLRESDKQTMLNKYNNWNIPKKWDESKVATQLRVNTNSINPSVENFTISIDEITNNSAVLKFSWENTQISVPFEVPTDKKTMASIKEVMKKNPNWRDYYNAAIYYRESNRDLQKAKDWMAKAIELDGGKYFVYRQQALILAALNDKT